MVVGRDQEFHHAVPRCLLRLHEEASECLEGVGAWLEWEDEAGRWGVDVSIPRADLEALVERSAVVLERDAHRLLHQSDWQRWGSRGGRETLRRYGTEWFALLALRRWNRITSEDLDAARVLR